MGAPRGRRGRRRTDEVDDLRAGGRRRAVSAGDRPRAPRRGMSERAGDDERPLSDDQVPTNSAMVLMAESPPLLRTNINDEESNTQTDYPLGMFVRLRMWQSKRQDFGIRITRRTAGHAAPERSTSRASLPFFVAVSSGWPRACPSTRDPDRRAEDSARGLGDAPRSPRTRSRKAIGGIPFPRAIVTGAGKAAPMLGPRPSRSLRYCSLPSVYAKIPGGNVARTPAPCAVPRAVWSPALTNTSSSRRRATSLRCESRIAHDDASSRNSASWSAPGAPLSPPPKPSSTHLFSCVGPSFR